MGLVHRATRATDVISKAEAALGPLSRGQRIDLLLDNVPELKGRDEAEEIVQLIEKMEAYEAVADEPDPDPYDERYHRYRDDRETE